MIAKLRYESMGTSGVGHNSNHAVSVADRFLVSGEAASVLYYCYYWHGTNTSLLQGYRLQSAVLHRKLTL